MKSAIQVIEQILLEVRRLNFQTFSTSGTLTIDTSTGATDPKYIFHEIHAITALTGLSYTDLGALPGSVTVTDLVAGDKIYGRFTKVIIATGTVRLSQMSTQ